MKYLIKSNDHQEVLDNINNGQNNYRPIVISTQNNDTQFGEDDNVIFLPKRFVEFNHKITQEKIDEFQQYVSENKINETIDVYELTSNGYIYDSFIVNEVEMAQPLSEIIETEYGPTNIESKHESIVLDFDTSLPLVTDGEIIGVFDETLTTDKPYVSICLKFDNMCHVMMQDTIDTFQNLENAPSLTLNGNTLTLEKDFALKFFKLMSPDITIKMIEQYGYSLSLIFSNEAVNVDSQDDSKETLKSIYGDKLLNLTIDYDYSGIDYSQITFNDKNINYCKDFSITFERPLVDDDYLILLGETIKISNNDLTYMWETKDNQTIYPNLYFVEILIKTYNMDYMKIYDENGNQIKYKISYRTGGTPENISVPLQPSEINVVAQISNNLYKKHKKSLVGSLMKWEYVDDYTGYITTPTLAHRYALHGSGGDVLINTSFCIDTIKLPNDVTFIPSNFCSNTTVRKMIIPSSVTSIGDSAFYYCSSLSSVTIPNSVTSIGSGAFYYCSSLTSVTIPNSVTSISFSAFYGTPFYNNLPNGDVYLGSCYYKYKGEMPSNTSITIKDGTKSICDSAFYKCTSLTSVIIPDSVTKIGDYAFQNCTSLTSIVIPDSVTKIGNYAFQGCKFDYDKFINNSSASGYPWNATICQYDGLYISGTTAVDCKANATNVTIPSSVTSIGDKAFDSCFSLSSITIPDSVTSIGDKAFDSCFSLSSITIPDSVTSIGSRAFNICTSLTSVTIPDTVTYIGYSAFTNCSSLTSVIIPSSVTSINDYVFWYCSSLSSVTIPSSVTSIGSNAFSYCRSLTSVTIPDSVTSIGNNTFENCSSLSSVIIPSSVTEISNGTFYSCESLSSIEIPDSVTTIGNRTFYSCESLSSIEIPDSITTIGSEAFYNCSGLTSIEIPDSVTRISYSTFHDCRSLTSVTIPSSVTTIGASAFQNCSSLSSVTIPSSVTSIGSNAFSYCTSLSSITCHATTKPTLSDYVFYRLPTNGKLYVPSGSDYSSWLSSLPSGWTIEYI